MQVVYLFAGATLRVTRLLKVPEAWYSLGGNIRDCTAPVALIIWEPNKRPNQDACSVPIFYGHGAKQGAKNIEYPPTYQ